MTPLLSFFGRFRRRSADRAPVHEPAVSWAADPESPDVPVEPREPSPAEVTPAHGVPAPPPPVMPPLGDPVRLARVDAALTSWRSELVDLGGVASLDDITVIDGVVDLTAAHPSGLAQLYAGRPTHLTNLIREHSALSVARQCLREVASRTESLARQFGVAPVYLAIGVATWNETVTRPKDEDDAENDDQDPEDKQPGLTPLERTTPVRSTRTVNAPVLLRPVRLTGPNAEAAITLEPTIEVNPVLVRALRRYGAAENVEAIARASLSREGFTPRSALARIGALGREYLPAFDVHERLVMGAFVHPGQALVEDFDAVEERARASALVAALAGDEQARAALDVTLPEPVRTDRAPSAERGIGDLDPAQLDAVEAVSSGASLLLDAPPGSDVADTLAAILADAAASGRTVLHVPASNADGHAVAQVLREAGLGSMVADLTEDPDWRRHAAETVRTALGVQVPDLDTESISLQRQRLVAVRRRLGRYIEALHRERDPWGVSAYDALQELAELTSGRARARTTARIAPEHMGRIGAEDLDRAIWLLHRAHTLGILSPRLSASAWRSLDVTDIDEVTDTLARLARLAEELLPTLTEQVRSVSDFTGLKPAATLSQWDEQMEVLDGVRESLDVFLPEVFERSAADLVIATATRRWREERSIEMKRSTRRRFIKQAKDLVRPGRNVSDLHGELVKVQRRRETWRRYDPDNGWPRLPRGLDDMQRTAVETNEVVAALQPVLGRAEDAPVLVDMPLDQLTERVRTLLDDAASAERMPEANQVLDELTELGLGPLVKDLAAREVPDSRIEDELTYCWWISILSYALRQDPDMGGLDADALTALAASLRRLDTAQSASLAGPVLAAYASRVRASVDADKDTARALYLALCREDKLPLRDVLRVFPLALTATPVWIVPPTLVPQVFTPDAVVDLAVLDASAQMPVAQVLPAFVRAEQVLVVGDPRRDTFGLAAELGSLLPRVTLPLGRHALDAEIAVFLAANGYDNVIDAVPAPPGAWQLSLDLVEGRGMPAPGQAAVESVPAEVERVVDLVIEHALTTPERSLAVIALNARHAEEVQRAINAATTGSPSLEAFFAEDVGEPFAVVDLTQVRSLRRDNVILSVGYAKTPHGRTIHSFGAVSTHGGMVGLVEALAVSRGTTQVVSCLAAEDIDPNRLQAAGPRLLRQVLARAGGEPAQSVAESTAPDRLLVDLAEHLWRKGLTVVPRYGVRGGVRIPLAIGHPDCPGELLVAVLTDDAAYVAEPSLRRRDRHWVERLERRGWHVYMAYSAGVFVDPEREAQAVESIVLDILTQRQAVREGRAQQVVPVRVEDVPEVLEGVPQGQSVTEPDGSLHGTEGVLIAGSSLGAGSASSLGGWGAGSAPGPGSASDLRGRGAEGVRGGGEPAGSAAGSASSAEAAGIQWRGTGASGASATSTIFGRSAVSAVSGVSATSAVSGASAVSAVSAASAASDLETVRERGPRPRFAQGLPLQHYSNDALDELMAWIRSDGVQREDFEEVEELRVTLGLQRRGSAVDNILKGVVRRGR